jgi:hypothetical protein
MQILLLFFEFCCALIVYSIHEKSSENEKTSNNVM